MSYLFNSYHFLSPIQRYKALIIFNFRIHKTQDKVTKYPNIFQASAVSSTVFQGPGCVRWVIPCVGSGLTTRARNWSGLVGLLLSNPSVPSIPSTFFHMPRESVEYTHHGRDLQEILIADTEHFIFLLTGPGAPMWQLACAGSMGAFFPPFTI
jgi:hypothetical protein